MHFTLPESWTRTKSIQTGVRGFPALKLLPIQVCWPLGLARLEFALALFTRRRWGLKDCSASLHLSADLIRLPLLLQPQDLVGLERTGSQSLCPSPPPPFFFLSLSPSLLLSLSISVLSISMPRPVPWSLSQRGTDQLGGSGGECSTSLAAGRREEQPQQAETATACLFRSQRQGSSARSPEYSIWVFSGSASFSDWVHHGRNKARCPANPPGCEGLSPL